MTAKRVLILTGMHRSGTSLISHLLHDSGITMGSKLMGGDIGNPHGYYEDTEFVDFHNAILQRNSLSLFAAEEDKLPLTFKAANHAKAQRIISERTMSAQWGWKDPRTIYFLDFWRGLIDGAVFIFLLRHPMAVVDSLIRRNTDPHIVEHPTLALKLWWVANREIYRFCKANSNQCLLFATDEVIAAPTQFLGHLAEKGFELTSTSFANIFKQQEFQTRHNGYTRFLQKGHLRGCLQTILLYHRLMRFRIPLSKT